MLAPCRTPQSRLPKSRRPTLLLVTLALGFSALASPAAAADPTAPDHARLSLERYAALLKAAQQHLGGQVALSGASMTIELPKDAGGAAVVRYTANVHRTGQGEAAMALLPAGVAITSATVDGEAVGLQQRLGFATLILSDGHEVAPLSLTYSVTSRSVASGLSLVIPIPQATATELRVSGADPAHIQILPAVSVRSQGAEAVAQIANERAVSIQWGQTSAGSAVRSARYRLVPDASGEGADISVELAVREITNSVRIKLAKASMALVGASIDGRALATEVKDGWHTAVLGRQAGSDRGSKGATITLTLRAAIDRSGGQPQVVLPLTGVPITAVEAIVPGKRTVHFEPAVPLKTDLLGKGKSVATRAVGHLPPTADVTIRWTESRAAPEQHVRVNTETWQLVTLAEGVLRSRVVIEHEVIRGKLSSLPVRIPDDVVVYKVTGPGVEDWRTYAAQGDSPRQVRISLAGSGQGKRSVQLLLERVASKTEGAKIAIPIVRPLGAHREMGVVALIDGDRVGFAKITSSSGFTAAGQDALPQAIRAGLQGKVSQAFRHIGPPEPLATTVAQARTQQVRFSAQVKALYHVTERTIGTTATVVVELKSGRRGALVLSLPAGVSEPRITAPSLNKVEPAPEFDAGKGRKAWRVRFTQKLEGAIQLHVEAEMLLPRALGSVVLPDLRVHGAEVEQGAVAVSSEAAIEVRAGDDKELRKLDVAELPQAMRRKSERQLLFGYRYAQAPWSLAVEIKRHKTVQTLDAVVSRAAVSSHVLTTGHLVTEARYEVVNTARQFLRLKLPDDAKVLAVAADGVGIKAVQDDAGAIKVPLTARTKQVVVVRFQVAVAPLATIGWHELTLPGLDVRVSDLHWTLRTPGDRMLFGLKSQMDDSDGPHSVSDLVGRRKAAGIDVAMPQPRQATARHFHRAVLDPQEAPPSLTFGQSAAPPAGLDYLLFILATGGLLWFGWRRVQGDNARNVWAVGGGALLITLTKQASFGWTFDEAGLLVVLAVAVVWAARRQRTKQSEDGAEADEPMEGSAAGGGIA